jgi:hypothetical protein
LKTLAELLNVRSLGNTRSFVRSQLPFFGFLALISPTRIELFCLSFFGHGIRPSPHADDSSSSNITPLGWEKLTTAI